MWRTAFDDVGDEYVLLSRQIDGGKPLVEVAAGGPYEGLALSVLFASRPLTYDHYEGGLGNAVAGNRISPRLRQRTAGAGKNLVPDAGEGVIEVWRGGLFLRPRVGCG